MGGESLRGVPVRDVVADGDLSRRRRLAIDEASAEARTRAEVVEPDSWSSAVALRTFGPGCLVVALAGTFDRSGVEQLRALRDDLCRLAHTELVVDLSALTAGQPALARMVAALRISRLSAGAQVELRQPPPELAAELGAHPHHAGDRP